MFCIVWITFDEVSNSFYPTNIWICLTLTALVIAKKLQILVFYDNLDSCTENTILPITCYDWAKQTKFLLSFIYKAFQLTVNLQ